tara:strand:+ start:401 stop:646 length:246 start_codon:yes stop_codon:yes gene_type:complete
LKQLSKNKSTGSTKGACSQQTESMKKHTRWWFKVLEQTAPVLAAGKGFVAAPVFLTAWQCSEQHGWMPLVVAPDAGPMTTV